MKLSLFTHHEENKRPECFVRGGEQGAEQGRKGRQGARVPQRVRAQGGCANGGQKAAQWIRWSKPTSLHVADCCIILTFALLFVFSRKETMWCIQALHRTSNRWVTNSHCDLVMDTHLKTCAEMKTLSFHSCWRVSIILSSASLGQVWICWTMWLWGPGQDSGPGPDKPGKDETQLGTCRKTGSTSPTPHPARSWLGRQKVLCAYHRPP